MRLFSKVDPPYLPEPDQGSVLRLALKPLALADWLQVDADFSEFQTHKVTTLTGFPDCSCVALSGSEDAQHRFSKFLLHQLSTRTDYVVDKVTQEVTHIPSAQKWSTRNLLLAQSSRWIQEDICLLEPDNTSYVLCAASVCSPSNWILEDKLGKSVDAIHVPVPGYAQQLAPRVNRLLHGLKPGKAFLRYNWSLQPDNELFWRPDIQNLKTAENLYWRVERQSMLKIPDSDTIVFSIRIYIHALATLASAGQSLTNLQTILARLPSDQQNYKGLTTESMRTAMTDAMSPDNFPLP